jgi:hypothetical protein
MHVGGLPRPSSYTPGVFTAIQAELAAHSGRMYTTTTLVNHQKKKRSLHQGTNTGYFLLVWPQHLHREGKKLTAASTRTPFYLAAKDQKDRVRCARAMLRCLRGGDINQCIFLDETTMEENPHPKSGNVCMHARMAGGGMVQLLICSARPAGIKSIHKSMHALRYPPPLPMQASGVALHIFTSGGSRRSPLAGIPPRSAGGC